MRIIKDRYSYPYEFKGHMKSKLLSFKKPKYGIIFCYDGSTSDIDYSLWYRII